MLVAHRFDVKCMSHGTGTAMLVSTEDMNDKSHLHRFDTRQKSRQKAVDVTIQRQSIVRKPWCICPCV